MLDDGSDLGRRKKAHRTTAERAAIVAESYEPGATVGGVARRHGIVASQLSSWRTATRRKADQDTGCATFSGTVGFHCGGNGVSG